jgi:hypothetical protein
MNCPSCGKLMIQTTGGWVCPWPCYTVGFVIGDRFLGIGPPRKEWVLDRDTAAGPTDVSSRPPVALSEPPSRAALPVELL